MCFNFFKGAELRSPVLMDDDANSCKLRRKLLLESSVKEEKNSIFSLRACRLDGGNGGGKGNEGRLVTCFGLQRVRV